MKNKKALIVIGLFILLFSIIGMSYAFWQLRLSQIGENQIASSCFDVKLEKEGTTIYLDKAFPIDDEEGRTLTPYKFTITNKCDANASYQINLETLEKYNTNTMITEDIRLNAEYIRAQLNEVVIEEELETEIEKEIVNLNDDIKVSPTLDNEEVKSYDAFNLATGYLKPKESKSFALRIWLDGKLTVEDNKDAMNKTFVSKITVVTSYLSESQMKPQVDLELAVCESNIIAQAKVASFEENSINTYEFKLDDNPDWETSESLTKSYSVNPGNHTVTLKVTTNTGVVSEIKKTIKTEIYEEPTTAVLGGKTIELTTEGNGLYKVGHCDVTGTTDDIGFSQEEYRYAGVNYDETSNPTDYVRFNEELWRIIGLVNVKTSSGNIEQRLKIIKDESIGSYAWNNENNNDWTQSTLMKILNEAYYESTNGNCSQYGAYNCDFNTKGIKETTKGMIDDEIIWNIGGWDTSNVLTEAIYNYERGQIGGYDAPTKYEWSASNTIEEITFHSIGIMYASDYGYAVGGTNRNICLSETTLWNYNECYDKDWLYFDREQWFLMPNSLGNLFAFYVYSYPSGRVIADDDRVYSPFGTHPVVYLSSKVKIVDDGHDGSYENPYDLELTE